MTFKCVMGSALLLLAISAGAQSVPDKKPELMSFVFRDTPIAELFEMISRKERVNILLARGVGGNVSVNLYDLTVRQAIFAIAEAGGYSVIQRGGGYVISDAKEAPLDEVSGKMEVRSMKVQYSDPRLIADVLAKHVSRGGKITVLDQRRMLIVEDTADGLRRIEGLLREIDAQPQQIMIEAKILEITLDTGENFGIDWTRVFSADGVNRGGTTGLATRGAPGLFFNVVNRNVELYLSALSNKGRVHTLATPKLLTLENQEATTNIGDKLGYRLTTTINNVTTESIQFLETGVILRVTPSVDAAGRIMMKIRPEVSSGSVSAGIPSKKTTEVTTQLVADDGQGILIAGLIKNSSGYRRVGVPILGELPGIGRLFSSTEDSGVSTETIVLITPRIVGTRVAPADLPSVGKLDNAEGRLLRISESLGEKMELLEGPETGR
ncbi:type II secretory pathway component GspD/PulD (secretin) [Actimicrobium sp. GrIS 1.19]|uniref:type II secretion system protein GspD n=1 Tax=Actimicrobium sp. GrIS 1.19 TaxID=3071708 RepID=UPI002DFAA89C|nr:type II secretory pathway component GspD/PulD (secretin) [Actimicrobium sp. GrIS 1.19]